MKTLKRYLAVLLAVTAMATTSVSCNDSEKSSSEDNSHYKSEDEFSVSTDENIKGENDSDISGQTIYWLAAYLCVILEHIF